jgi:hypothetical protein
MSSIRLLKKDINCLTEELISECFVYQHFHPELTDKKLFGILQKLTDARNKLIERVNHAVNIEDIKEKKHLLNSVRDEISMLLEIMEDLKK